MKTKLEAIMRYRPAVSAGLTAYIKEQAGKPGAGLKWQAAVAERLLQFATSGKLLRGSLVCYGYSLWDGSTPLPAGVVDTAVALELAHAALLIHDDIIDQDELRRNQPAMHVQYRQLFADSLASPRLSESLALCAGDMTLFFAFELLGALPLKPGTTSLATLLARELANVCAGQMQDVYLSASDHPPGKRDIYAVMRAKTAGYSLALPLLAGAQLAGQPASTRQQLYAFGLAAGTLFQMRDDELGVFGTANKMGKPVGADIREGKKTLLYYYLWQAGTAAERRQWQAVFGNPTASQADITAVRRALRRYDVPSRLQADIDRLQQKAMGHLDRLHISGAAKRELQGLVEFCARREV